MRVAEGWTWTLEVTLVRSPARSSLTSTSHSQPSRTAALPSRAMSAWSVDRAELLIELQRMLVPPAKKRNVSTKRYDRWLTEVDALTGQGNEDELFDVRASALGSSQPRREADGRLATKARRDPVGSPRRRRLLPDGHLVDEEGHRVVRTDPKQSLHTHAALFVGQRPRPALDEVAP